MRIRRHLLVIVVLFYCLSSHAQNDFSSKTWLFLDTSIAYKHNLSDLEKIVEKLSEKAWAEEKYFYAARCVQYQIRITDKKTEDTFYFKNSVVLDELLAKQQPPAFEYALHLLKANRLIFFIKRHDYYYREKYQWKNIPVNYAAYDNNQLDSIAQIDFEKAKLLAKDLGKENLDEALWLSSDPLQFLFKPDLADIVFAEQVNSKSRRYSYPSPVEEMLKSCIELSSQDFILKLDSLANGYKGLYTEFRYYHDWMTYHSGDPAAYTFIEALAREYIYGEAKKDDKNIDKPYERYLTRMIRSPHDPVRAYSIYQLCLLWIEQADRYFPGEEREYDYKQSKYLVDYKDYDTAFRYHPVKALNLFNENKNLFDSFFYLKKILLNAENILRSSDLTLTLQQNNLPGETILGELKFRSTDTLHYRLIKLKQGEKEKFKPETAIDDLLKQTPWKEKFIPLPATSEFNFHNLYLQLDPMPAGNYAILFSSKQMSDTTTEKEYLYFDVTLIASLNSGKRIYILDRKTGKPLAGAKVKAVYKKANDDNVVTSRQSLNYTVNSRGFIEVANAKYDILEISNGADSVTQTISYAEAESSSDETDTPEGGGAVMDFYKDNTTSYVFTDRSIYRPGQTVYYKVLFVTKNRETGEHVLLNKQNLQEKIFNALLRRDNPMLYIKNPFSNEMDSVKIVPNDFGSVSGSFKIPKTAATGEWNIDCDVFSRDWSTGSFKIEEYKRPSYEISIDKPVKEIKLKDEFSFKVKVNSFAGAALNGVGVNYKIIRTVYHSGDEVKNNYANNRFGIYNDNTKADTIIRTSGFTDNDGVLDVKIKDESATFYPYSNDEWWSYNYTIEAEAVDEGGEAYESSSSLTISSKPVEIYLPLYQTVYKRSEIEPVPLLTFDENAGTVSKEVKIKIYHKQKEEKLLGKRELTKSDLWLYDQQSLQNKFPFENIIPQEAKESKELVKEIKITTHDSSQLNLSPDYFSKGSGEYMIEATCEIDGKIIGTKEVSFKFLDDKQNKLPETTWNFSHVPSTSVKAGEKLEYYYGSSVDETYSVFEIGYFAKGKKLSTRYLYEEESAPAGLHRHDLRVPANATEKIVVTQLFILHNQLFKNEEIITIEEKPLPEPEIIVERYRKKLSPGSKETFTVSVKTKNVNTVAELMTTMYDASLDKLEAHSWNAPDLSNDEMYFENDWTSFINDVVKNNKYSLGMFGRLQLSNILANQKSTRSLWWLNPLEYSYENIFVEPGHYSSGGYTYMLDIDRGTVNGIGAYNRFNQHDMNTNYEWGGFASTSAVPFLRLGAGWTGGPGLTGSVGANFNVVDFNPTFSFGVANQLQLNYTTGDRTVIPGSQNLFGIKTRGRIEDLSFTGKKFFSSSEPFIQGDIDKKVLESLPKGITVFSTLESIERYKQPLIILDGTVYTGNLNDIDVKKIKSGIVMKGGEAVSLFGNKAADGVLVLSTQGYLDLLVEEKVPVVPRKNFNELAFFYPTVYADKDGYYSFNFTMPETVTKWNWKMMAHTKNLLFAYAERELNTQLPLMVQPSMPRLLYRDDRIVLQSRITNLDSINNNGKIICKVEDAVTGEDITAKTVTVKQNNFAVEKKSNINSPFEIKVPAGQQNPLKITVTVRSENFADGEEHIIPVLSPKVFVKESQPFYFNQRNDTSISFSSLPADAELYGIGLSVQPQPQAALIYSLPYLAGYPYGCAEQTFNKLFAYAAACKLMRDNKELQQSFEEAKKEVEKRDAGKEKLPNELSSEIMPWLDLADHTASMQQKLFNLLDTSRSKPVIDELLGKLHKMQNSNGGIAWFPGGKNNYYISCYVLKSFGHLAKNEQEVTEAFDEQQHKDFIEKLVTYLDNAFADKLRNNEYDYTYYSYARSYWLTDFPLEDSLKSKIKDDLVNSLKQWKLGGSLYSKALLLTTAFRYASNVNDELNTLALSELNSIKQSAIEDEQNGLRWKELSTNEDLRNSAEETIVLLAEAFEQAKYPSGKNYYTDVVNKIIKWLLTAKKEHSWTSTKATAAAINMLQKEKSSVARKKQSVKLTVAGKTIKAGNDLLSGSGFNFFPNNSVFVNAAIEKLYPGEAAGYAYRYYFTGMPPQDVLNKDVQLEKKFYLWNEKENKWNELKAGDKLKIADKVKVTINIHTLKTLPYVFLDDKRAALFEPLSNNSGYEYNDQLSYYKSVRDAGFQFFFDNILPGAHEITYEMKVAQEGNFFSGPAVLQCMYKPELTAYSGSDKFTSGKE